MWLRSSRIFLANATFCQFSTNDIIYQYLLLPDELQLVLQKTMDVHSFQPKELAETGTSFFQRSGFQYRNQEKTIDYTLLRQTQRQRITNLFKNDPFFNEDKLLQLFENIEEESNRFIQSLLQQLTAECKKNRQLKNDYETVLREKNTEARRLSEKNMELMAEVKAEKTLRESEKNELEGVIKGKQKMARSLNKQSQGLKMLLQEYENELEVANMKIADYMEELSEKYQSMELMVTKIDELNQFIQKYEEKQQILLAEKKEMCDKMERNKNASAKLELANQKLEQALRKIKNQQNELCALQSRQKSQNQLVQHLQMKLLQANGELVQQQKTTTQLKAFTSQKSDLILKKDNEWKLILQDLQSKTKRSIQKLKENYEKKIKKLVGLLQREVKSLRLSYENTKQFMQKEMLLFLKMTQRDVKERSKSLISRP